MKKHSALIGLAVASLCTSGIVSPSVIEPARKRRPRLVLDQEPHPEMPEGGWPETRQQRRARERANNG